MANARRNIGRAHVVDALGQERSQRPSPIHRKGRYHVEDREGDVDRGESTDEAGRCRVECEYREGPRADAAGDAWVDLTLTGVV